MARRVAVLLVLGLFVSAGCLGPQTLGDQRDEEREPPKFTVEAVEPINVTVEAHPSGESEPVLNETIHMELGDETTFGPGLAREPHTFVLHVDDRTWSRSVEPGQHLTVRVDADGNVTVVSNAA